MAEIDERWKGAQVVQAAACPQGGAASSVVAGDLNGDGRIDLALRVQAADGLHLVVALTRTDDYDLWEITKGVPGGNVQLTVKPRGMRYYRKDSTLDNYFPADTLTVTPCGQPSVAFYWTGNSFDPMPLSDAPTS